MKKGFTLLELIVVIIIIGILGALGFIQYTKVVEKSRTAEAKDILGQLRTAQEAYRQETGSYTATLGNLFVEMPTACTSTHYFTYSLDATTGTATRCSASGKSPQGPATPYTITITYSTGAWGGSAGYY